MKKFLVVLSSVALLGLLAVPGFTQGHRHWGGGPGGMGGPGMMFPFMLSKLNLTSDQQAAVDKIMSIHRSNLQNYFSQMEAAHEKLTAKLLAPTPNLTTDDLDTTEISGLREKLMQEGLQAAVAIHNVLTPDQLNQASTLHTQMKALHDQMRSMLGK